MSSSTFVSTDCHGRWYKQYPNLTTMPRSSCWMSMEPRGPMPLARYPTISKRHSVISAMHLQTSRQGAWKSTHGMRSRNSTLSTSPLSMIGTSSEKALKPERSVSAVHRLPDSPRRRRPLHERHRRQVQPRGREMLRSRPPKAP